MPRIRVYEAITERLEILDVDGCVDAELMPDLDAETMVNAYRGMVRTRIFDGKALLLQRQGRMGTWPPSKGQEAVSAGVGLAMGEFDWLVPAFREHGLQIERGIPAHLLYAYWNGDERGAQVPEGLRCFPNSVPVGSQWLHGVGVGMSLKLRDENAAAVTFGGDGSTSEGDFHEAMNFGAVFKTKTVFVIQNNQWAISVPISSQTKSETLAQKAHAYGLPGIQVDGNDVFAIYVAVKEALERARRGDGPTLIEALTYRLGDHTTADDASRYRPDEEVQTWLQRDPIIRLRLFLESRSLWDDEKEQALVEESTQWVDEQVKAFEAMEPQQPEDVFKHMYKDMPPSLREQMQFLADEVNS